MADTAPLDVVILAAGKGTRMRSDLPKVLHPLAGRPMLAHVVDAAAALGAARTCVVIGYGAEAVRAAFPAADLRWAIQAEQHGTGHAVAQALPLLDADGVSLILYGDVPLIQPASLRRLTDAARGGALALLTVELADPHGYGRIVRDAAGRVSRIVEQKDASAAELALREVNTGIMALPTARLRQWVGALGNDNAQGEYYLTDIVAMAVGEGVVVISAAPAQTWEILGVNSQAQRAELERIHQTNQAAALMDAGVTLADPARLDVRGRLECGRDVVIDVNCVFEGNVTLGDGVTVGANCVLRDVSVAAGGRIAPFSLLEQATVGPDCLIGPYARLRPGAELARAVHVGNFVEIKNSRVGEAAKVNHLSYVGDADVGKRVNVGAGTITCNYDGANKHRTVIGDDAFIGSNSALVAPVTVGAGATLGAGTTLGKDAPAGQLTVTRPRQITVPGWKRPVKRSTKKE